MADNVTVDNGTLTDFDVATDDIGGKHYQRFKMTWGPDGTANDADTAQGKQLPTRSYEVGGQIIDETGTLRTVVRAFVNATASGNTSVVSAQGGGIRIRVLSVKVVTATTLTVKFQSATTDISPGESLPANGGFVMPRNVDGWFQTAANEALNINLSGAGTVGCTLTYVQAT